MKPSEHIFFLIQSLTKTEKGYFNKFAKRHGLKNDSNYLKLFRAIEQQKTYDEKALQKKFSGNQLGEQIAVYKNYLYKLILRSLHNYYSGNTSTSKISELIHYSEILKERGLFNQAKKVLEQASEIALKYEHKELLLDIIRREEDMLLNSQEFDEDSEAFIQQAYKDKMQLLKKIELVSERNRQAALIKIGMRTKGLFNIADEPELRLPKVDDNTLVSFDSTKLYYWMCGVYHKSRDDFKKSLEYFGKLLDMFDKNEHQVDENLQLYISCLYHVITTAEEIHDEKVYNHAIKKLEHLDARLQKESRFKANSLRIRMILVEARIFHLFKKSSFEEIRKIAAVVEKEGLLDGIEEYAAKHGQEYIVGRKEVLVFYIGVFLLEGGYSKESIHWLNQLAAAKGDAAKSGAKLYSKLIILIAYYETADFTALKNATRHYLRIVGKESSKYKFDKLFAESLLKLANAKTRKAKSVLYLDLKEKITHYSTEKKHNQSFHYFDFPEWIESKIQDKPMAAILSERK